uniref:MPN domain-containing protein n=1 Tax=Araucaria cunninghamii TaxID=56994 RepID=A0A0D6R0B3_ARACU
MMIRLRSRDGLERVKVDNPNATVGELKSLIQSQLNVPIASQTLSKNQNILIAKGNDAHKFCDMADPNSPLSLLGIGHGHIIFLAYDGNRTIAGPQISPAGSFGKKMTMDDLIARQMRIERQEKPHCQGVSFDRDAANAFQQYVNETLAFAVKRGGLMYGTVSEEGEVSVNFIYEPPQQGTEDKLFLLRDPEEEKQVEAIAIGLGMRKVGFIFTQTVTQGRKDCTLWNSEVRQAVELHADSGLKEWVTALVKLEVNEDGGADVHFEPFQLSDQCVKLFKEGWFAENCEGLDPKITRMTKDVVILGKDTRDVDNDFFLVLVKILDHQGPLSTNFPIENRASPVKLRALKSHLDRTKNLPYVKRLSDFHLLLLLAKYLDVNADVPQLAACVQAQAPIPEGYQILIDSLASNSRD